MIERIPNMPQDQYSVFFTDIQRLFLESRRWQKEIKKYDPSTVYADVNCPYYSQAFGVIHALQVLGYGILGPVNTKTHQGKFNLRYWFEEMYSFVAEITGYECPVKRRQNIMQNNYDIQIGSN